MVFRSPSRPPASIFHSEESAWRMTKNLSFFVAAAPRLRLARADLLRCRFFLLRFWRRNFPIAAFLQAGTYVLGLGELVHNKGSAALGAGLRKRFVWRSEIAFRVAIAAIENAAPSFLGSALDELARSALGTVDPQRL